MIWLLAAVVVVPQAGVGSQALPKGNLYQQVIPQTTGQNGYEEYVKAATMIVTTDFERWSQLDQGNGGSTPSMPTGLRPNASYLERNQWVLSRLKPAFELVKLGNLKPVADPRSSVGTATVYPELLHFRRLSRAMVGAAYAEYAAGQSAQGTERLLQGLTFGDNVSRSGTLIAHLVGIAQMGLGFGAFESRLSQLSKSDCQRIVDGTSSLLERPSAYADVLSNERDLNAKALDEIVDGKDDWLQESEFRGVTKKIGAMSQQDREGIRRIAKQRVKEEYDALIRVVRGPESQWNLVAAESPKPTRFDTPDSIADVLVDYLVPVTTQGAAASIRMRTQMRLLRLHARVLAYRWEENKLPARLADAVPAPELVDPANGESFDYVVLPDGYKLVSRGRPGLDVVALRYRRTAPPATGAGIPPR